MGSEVRRGERVVTSREEYGNVDVWSKEEE